MASTYTTNLGIEKIGSGEQAGTWGTTTNNNLDIIDEAVNGVVSIALTTTSKTLTTSNGSLSEGGRKVLVFTGSPGGDCTVNIDPENAEKMYFIDNQADQKLIINQGSGGTVGNSRAVEIPASSKGLIYADGAGSSNAKVVDLLNGITFGNTKLTATATEINTSTDGSTTVGTDAIADDDGIVTNDGGTMKQTKVQTFSTYFNANLVTVPSAITATTHTLTPSVAQSHYQKVDTSSNNVALTLAIGSLAIGQYIIVDKTSSSNTLTISYPSNSQGVSLGNSVSFAIAINQNGSIFTFVESIKY
jgi:hypothetical protein